MDYIFVLNQFLRPAFKFFLYASVYYIFFYLVFKKQFASRKIQKEDFKKNELIHDALNSLMSFFIFAMISLLYVSEGLYEHTKIYMDFSQHSTLWNILSLPLLIMMYDTWFYWTHRLMHHKWFYSLVHSTHHKTTNPSPFTSYSFHPIEAFIHYIWIIPAVYLIPFHGYILVAFGTLLMFVNISGHGGIEKYSERFMKSRIGKWINTSTYHNSHHEYSKGNYGIFFTFWDRIMGTMNKDHSKLSQNETDKP